MASPGDPQLSFFCPNTLVAPWDHRWQEPRVPEPHVTGCRERCRWQQPPTPGPGPDEVSSKLPPSPALVVFQLI